VCGTAKRKEIKEKSFAQSAKKDKACCELTFQPTLITFAFHSFSLSLESLSNFAFHSHPHTQSKSNRHKFHPMQAKLHFGLTDVLIHIACEKPFSFLFPFFFLFRFRFRSPFLLCCTQLKMPFFTLGFLSSFTKLKMLSHPNLLNG
jgi:hypothetical protein